MSKPVYKEYFKGKNFSKKTKKRFFKFLRILKKFYRQGNKVIGIKTIHRLIRRLTSDLPNKKRWKSKPRRYYFKYWVKAIKKAGYIKENQSIYGGIKYKITDKILQVDGE